jgi:hypothetical protein
MQQTLLRSKAFFGFARTAIYLNTHSCFCGLKALRDADWARVDT